VKKGVSRKEIMLTHTRKPGDLVPFSRPSDRFWGSLAILSPMIVAPTFALVLGVSIDWPADSAASTSGVAAGWMLLPVRALAGFAGRLHARRTTARPLAAPSAPRPSSSRLSTAA
jgi:hypothetical protein